jgi:ubiquinone/menaquinone biosynthesis C-methylase UbiE
MPTGPAARRMALSDLVRGPAIHAAISALHLPAGSHGLDAGCGIGVHTGWLADTVGARGSVTGLDTAPDLLAIAASDQARLVSAGRVSFVAADLGQLPFADATFDWAWSADTVHGTADPMCVVHELARVTRPGGRVALLFWSSQRLLPGHPLLEAKLDAAFARTVPYMTAPPESHFQRATGWLQRAGLENLHARTLVADLAAPLGRSRREALAMVFDMLWGSIEADLSEADRATVRHLCQPDSPGFIADDPAYAAFITYSLTSGRVPRQ